MVGVERRIAGVHASSSQQHQQPPPPKACIFDIGGVVVGSPLVGINRYEREHGLPRDYINVAITARGREGAFQRLERSELDLYSFYRDFGKELSDAPSMNKWYTDFCRARGREAPRADDLPASLTVDGRELFGIMMKESTIIDPHVAEAIRRLRESGKFVLAALTNNFAPPTNTAPAASSSVPESSAKAAPTLDEELEHLGLGRGTKVVRTMFDHYIESAVVGMRKPELGFFEHALDVLGVKAEEAVFLDDIGMCVSYCRMFETESEEPVNRLLTLCVAVYLHSNLKAAQSLGLRTIREYSKNWTCLPTSSSKLTSPSSYWAHFYRA